MYVKAVFIDRKAKSAFCKFRSGVAPINIEIERYNKVPVKDRICPFCPGLVEDEVHVLTVCNLYDDLRRHLFEFLSNEDFLFETMCNKDKTRYILSGNNINILKKCANACKNILTRRLSFTKGN